MRNGKDSCLFGEELVSYIYDELPASERISFEEHLLNCSSCTSEFAELSMSRLGVYEWHRDEFVPLETPQFVIPYATPAPAYAWMEAIRGLIFTPARLSFAGGALAILVVAIGLFYGSDSSTNGIVENQPAAPPVVEMPALAVSKGVDEVSADKYIGSKALAEGRPTAITRSKAVKKTADRQLTARGGRSVKAPRLGTFEEVEDTSLRLVDLVADIDSFKK